MLLCIIEALGKKATKEELWTVVLNKDDWVEVLREQAVRKSELTFLRAARSAKKKKKHAHNRGSGEPLGYLKLHRRNFAQ